MNCEHPAHKCNNGRKGFRCGCACETCLALLPVKVPVKTAANIELVKTVKVLKPVMADREIVHGQPMYASDGDDRTVVHGTPKIKD